MTSVARHLVLEDTFGSRTKATGRLLGGNDKNHLSCSTERVFDADTVAIESFRHDDMSSKTVTQARTTDKRT